MNWKEMIERLDEKRLIYHQQFSWEHPAEKMADKTLNITKYKEFKLRSHGKIDSLQYGVVVKVWVHPATNDLL